MSVRLDPNLNFGRANVSLGISSTNNDYATTNAVTYIGVPSSGSANVTGLANPAPGQLRFFVWQTGIINFLAENAGSTATNRFRNAFALDGSINRKAAITMYDGARWVVVGGQSL